MVWVAPAGMAALLSQCISSEGEADLPEVAAPVFSQPELGPEPAVESLLEPKPFSPVLFNGDKPLTFEISQTAPPGFENLEAVEEFIVDVYFDNDFLSGILAVITTDHVQFLNTDSIVQALPELLDPDYIAEFLNDPLSKNSQQLCYNARGRSCALLSPEVAGIVFDSNQKRADLFIHPDYLSQRSALDNIYLGDSDSGLAVLQNFSASASGSASDNAHALYSQTLIGFQENHLRLSWDVGDNRDPRVTQLAFERDYQGKRFQAGWVDNLPVTAGFARSERFMGVGYSTSNRSRIDTRHQRSTPLEVFLPLAGRVELYRDDRLLQSHYFPAGNQQIDTSSLPQGAYSITIRVVGEEGQLLSETEQFFVKSSQLPGMGAPEYFIQAGYDLDKINERFIAGKGDSALVRGGSSIRLSDNTGLTLAAGVTEGQSFIENSLFYQGMGFEFSPSILIGQDKVYGLGLDGQATFRYVTMFGNYQQVWRSAPAENDQLDLLGNARQQIIAGLSGSLRGGQWNLSYSRNASEAINNSSSYSSRKTVYFTRNLYSSGNFNVSLRSQASQTDSGKSVLFTLDFRQRHNDWSHNASVSSNYQDNRSDSVQNALSLSGDRSGIDVGTGKLTTNYGVDIDRSKRVRGGLRYEGRPGHLSASATHTLDNSTYMNVNGSTSFAINQDAFSYGGRRNQESALLVTLDGADGEYFDILVNNRPEAIAAGNQKKLIHLSPFNEYDVRIRPRGYGAYQFDGAIRRVNLYPGNITTIDYSIDSYQLLLARIVDRDGNPVSSANVLSEEVQQQTTMELYNWNCHTVSRLFNFITMNNYAPY